MATSTMGTNRKKLLLPTTMAKAGWAIVEARDATPAQREIREINTGVYAASASFFRAALREILRKKLSPK